MQEQVRHGRVMRPIRYFQKVRSDTDTNAPGVWCPRVGKYMKPRGWVDGIERDDVDFPDRKPRYIIEPRGLGPVDSP